MPLIPPKEFKHYEELVELLSHRGMIIDDETRAKRKLTQVGYYRLSGFSYPCRSLKRDDHGNVVECPRLNRPLRENTFEPDTHFNDVFNLYLFDKRLRLAMLDGLERIEIFVRSIIAHEVGRGKTKETGTGIEITDPLAWKDDEYISPKFLKKRGYKPSQWDEWVLKHSKLIDRSREDCIIWHKTNQKEMPFWVVIEAWDFGTLSKYYGMLKDRFRQRICARIGIKDKKDTDVLASWLREMNILRNRCAHHCRIWNQPLSNPLKLTSNPFFTHISSDQNALTRIYGLITTMWFIIQQIGSNSTWMQQLESLFAQFPSLPGCSKSSLGLRNE